MLSSHLNAVVGEMYSSQLFTLPVSQMAFCSYAARACELPCWICYRCVKRVFTGRPGMHEVDAPSSCLSMP